MNATIKVKAHDLSKLSWLDMLLENNKSLEVNELQEKGDWLTMDL